MGKNEIMIKENDINWLELIEMAFKRKGWGKIHTLFVCEDVSITGIINTFDFKNNVATFKLECNYINDELSSEWDNYMSLDYHLDSFTVDNFKLLLLKKIRTIISYIVEQRTKKKAREEFEDIYFTDSNIGPQLIEEYNLSSDYEIIEDIGDENIRDNCMIQFNEKILDLANEKYYNQLRDYCENNKESLKNLDILLDKINDLIDKTSEVN